MIQSRSFKFRLTLWYAFMLTVFLGGFAFLMYTELSRVLYRDVQRSMYEESRNIEDGLRAYFQETKNPKFLIPPKIEKGSIVSSPDYKKVLFNAVRDWEKQQRRIDHSLFLVRILGLDHSIIVSNRAGWEREVIFPNYERDSVFMEKGHSYQTIYFKKSPIRLYYHLVKIYDRPFLIIQIAKPLYEIEKTLGRLIIIIMVIIPMGVALACFAGWFLAKRFLNPVERMIQQARKITAAYLKNRLPRTFTHDELDRLAETLNEMIDRLEASTRAVQDFSSNVSHEFKTPLAIIRGEIDLALRRERSPEDLQKTIGIISEEVDGLIRLVDDLMFLVRNDAKQIQLQKKNISLAPILEQVLKLYRERAHKEGIEMVLEVSKDGEVLGDEIYLKRLFTNLLDNAIKFSNRNSRVSARILAESEYAVVEIEDSGIGIDPETLANIGKRFYRADQARSKEGAGLGFSIVKAICDAHQGILLIESAAGKGTKVTLKLPLLGF
ncbi:MAG TPA: ATP-binding protein [Candidatus Omnitrophota bacterium]|nr:ATP-binding protein [Candidatus Omnitrophota bacterium]